MHAFLIDRKSDAHGEKMRSLFHPDHFVDELLRDAKLFGRAKVEKVL